MKYETDLILNLESGQIVKVFEEFILMKDGSIYNYAVIQERARMSLKYLMKTIWSNQKKSE